MAMGSTGTVNMTPEMFRSAISVVEDYEQKAAALRAELGETVNSLIPGNFSGQAAEGFQYFHTSTIEPVIDESLTKLMNALKEILEATLNAIPYTGGLDEQLGEGNRQG